MAEPPCPKVIASNHKICEEMEFTNDVKIHTCKTYRKIKCNATTA